MSGAIPADGSVRPVAGLHRRDVLELEKLRLEVAEARRRAESTAPPSRWAWTTDMGRFLVVAIPILLSVAAFFIDNHGARQLREHELELREEQLAVERLKVLTFGLEKLKELPEAATLFLSLYPERKAHVEILVGMVQIEPPDDAEWPWPTTSRAALEGLRRVGAERLSAKQRNYLLGLVNRRNQLHRELNESPDEGKQEAGTRLLQASLIAREIVVLLDETARLEALDEAIRQLKESFTGN